MHLYTVKVVTDSTADLTPALADEMWNLGVIIGDDRSWLAKMLAGEIERRPRLLKV